LLALPVDGVLELLPLSFVPRSFLNELVLRPLCNITIGAIEQQVVATERLLTANTACHNLFHFGGTLPIFCFSIAGGATLALSNERLSWMVLRLAIMVVIVGLVALVITRLTMLRLLASRVLLITFVSSSLSHVHVVIFTALLLSIS
jgi:hypothetical protein